MRAFVLRDFLQDLFEGRPVQVGYPQPLATEAKAAAASFLVEFEQSYRLELPGEAPAFDPQVGVWSAEVFYLAASLAIHRDVSEVTLHTLLSALPPDRSNPDVHYSVDLTMRFLPSLVKLSKSAAADDPLVKRLMQWAVCWPLSSVGILGVSKVDASPLRTSPVLMRLYADRVISYGDQTRLEDQSLAEEIRRALGDYPELCVRVAGPLAIGQA
ncbi:MAG: hypothetical protein KDB22_23690 [Planctomycetales bacterium]|nr:hypothetical protein [Planctomycetales bacterium]